jgi:hypothetical protein
VENKGAKKGCYVHKKKFLKMIGTMIIREKRGTQWFFFTPIELYSDMNNTTVEKCPDS